MSIRPLGKPDEHIGGFAGRTGLPRFLAGDPNNLQGSEEP